jgi:hypothetical protein
MRSICRLKKAKSSAARSVPRHIFPRALSYLAEEKFCARTGSGRKRERGKLAHVPTLFELMDKYKTPGSGRRLATALLASGEFHRLYLAPPNMRPEHVRSLREVFMKTVKDPAFVAEAKNKKLDIDPSSGEEVEMLGREVMSQPPEVVERLKKLLGK